MFEHEVVLGHPRNVAHYLGANGLGVSVEREIIVIGSDYNLMFRSQEQVPPMRERANDRQEFSIIHVIIAFHWIQGLGVVPYRLEFSPVIPLIQDCPECVLRSIHL